MLVTHTDREILAVRPGFRIVTVSMDGLEIGVAVAAHNNYRSGSQRSPNWAHIRYKYPWPLAHIMVLVPFW
jgi:hypothetical protein